MKNSKISIVSNAFMGIAMAAMFATTATAQVSKESLESISTPDQVETSIGTLKFLDGAPYPETAEKVYDELDRMRGVDAFLKGIPGASIRALVEGVEDIGAVEAHQVAVFKDMMNANQLFLTGGNSSMYIFPTFDLERDGPTVVEVPAGILGMFDDAWFRYLEDVGPLGPDKAKGGKYLLLPPGYEGEVPEGYFVVKSPSYIVWGGMRANVKDGMEAAYQNIIDNLRIYPLSRIDNQPEMEFINASQESFNTIHANDFKFYEEIDRVIQKEPLAFIDAETRGLFASIGIVKGKPFAPDARMKRILTDAVAIGNATARSIVWYPRTEGTMKGIEVFPGTGSYYVGGWVDKNVFYNGKDGHTMNSDARTFFHYMATAVTPAMAVTIPGAGSDYAIAFVDSEQQPLDGSKTYKVHLPPNVPVANFWSITLFDSQTRSMLKSDQKWPSIQSFDNQLQANADGSYDIYFAPEPPEGMETNWIHTVPGRSWFSALGIYSPLEPWIEKTWQLSEIELVD